MTALESLPLAALSRPLLAALRSLPRHARARLDQLVALDAGRRKDPGSLGTRYHLKTIELVRDEARNELLADIPRDSAERFTLQDVVRLLLA